MAELAHFDSSTLSPLLKQLRIRKGVKSVTLAADATITQRTGNFLALDPGGANRNVDLPAEDESEGAVFWVFNAADAAENLVVRAPGPSTVVTVNQGELAVVGCDGVTWFLLGTTSVDISALNVDTISESTADAGVTVDGVLNKDARTYDANVNDELLAAAKVLVIGDAQFQRLDPGGATRLVDLPAEAVSTGLAYRILNTADAAEDLTVRDDGGGTIATVSQNEAAWFACDGTTWFHNGIETIALS